MMCCGVVPTGWLLGKVRHHPATHHEPRTFPVTRGPLDLPGHAMIRPILQLGDPILKARARPIEPGELVEGLARDMAETLARAGGVGLAAPQVGESVRLILAGSFPTAANPDRPDVPIAPMVNPRVVAASG